MRFALSRNPAIPQPLTLVLFPLGAPGRRIGDRPFRVLFLSRSHLASLSLSFALVNVHPRIQPIHIVPSLTLSSHSLSRPTPVAPFSSLLRRPTDRPHVPFSFPFHVPSLPRSAYDRQFIDSRGRIYLLADAIPSRPHYAFCLPHSAALVGVRCVSVCARALPT